MIQDHYQSEAHMRAAHPYIANLLVNIAQLEAGVYTAQTAGKTYSWNINGN